jgi:hypothetical protein
MSSYLKSNNSYGRVIIKQSCFHRHYNIKVKTAHAEKNLTDLITKLEAQWSEPVSLTFHSALRKLNTEPPIDASHQLLVIWLSRYREEDI